MGIAIEVSDYSCLKLIRNEENDCPPPPSTPKLTHWGGGGGYNQGVGRQVGHLRRKGGAGSSIETRTEYRRGRPALSLTLGNAGFTSLADKKWMCYWSTDTASPGGYCEGY